MLIFYEAFAILTVKICTECKHTGGQVVLRTEVNYFCHHLAYGFPLEKSIYYSVNRYINIIGDGNNRIFLSLSSFPSICSNIVHILLHWGT